MNSTVFIIRSCSGDVDIPVLLLGSAALNLSRVYIDSGTGKHRRNLHLGEQCLNVIQRPALLGMHAFTGNDYISSFFRKGKKRCWQVVNGNEEFQKLFSELGEAELLTDNQLHQLEKFTCALYGKKSSTSVNQVRRELFWKKLNKQKKIIDLSLLPPCLQSLQKHCHRANYVSRMWRLAHQPV